MRSIPAPSLVNAMAIATLLGVASAGPSGCIPKQGPEAAEPAAAEQQQKEPAVVFAPPKPPAPAQNPRPVTPSMSWDANNQNWDFKDKQFNANLRSRIIGKSPDPGTTAGLIHTLTFYAKKSGDDAARVLAKELLDRTWKKYREEGKGVVAPEVRKDYKRFNDPIYIPPGWTGKMANGDVIDQSSTFVSIRSKYKQDPAWPKVEAYLKGGKAPEFTYHRFWAQAHIALAYATYGWLFPEDAE